MELKPITKFKDFHKVQFLEQGYLRLGKLLSYEELTSLQKRIDEIMLGKITYEGMPMQLDQNSGTYANLSRKTAGHKHKTLNYRRIDDLHMDPLFLTYMQHPLIGQIVRRFIGENVSIFRAMFMNKPAERGTELPWHQDIGHGWGLDQNPFITVWTALDNATVENGCMQIVPGSNNLGILNEGHYTSEEDQIKYTKGEDVIDLETEAGEAILLHNFLLHRSGINPTGLPRRAFSVAYMDATTRKRSTEEPFPVIFGENALKS